MFTIFVLAILTTTLLMGCDVAAPTAPAGTAAPLTSYAWPYDVVLAEPAWLAAHLHDANVRVVDVSAPGAYQLGHIPGAVQAYWQDLIEKNSPTYGKLAGKLDREQFFSDLGIAYANTTVVVYDRDDNRAAARTAWALWYAGHPNVRLLNGGLAAWIAAGKLLERATPPSVRIPNVPGPSIIVRFQDLPDESVHANRCDLSRAVNNTKSVILDLRTDADRAETWGGTVMPGSVASAKRLPWTTFVRDLKLPAFRSPDDLRLRLSAVGATPDKQIWLYGLASNDAALPFFALKALGYVHVRVYDGGWAEWGANPAIVTASC